MNPRALFVSLRPHQWTKNLLVFAAARRSRSTSSSSTPFLRSPAAFALFCGLSGVVYLVNDVVDLERDRLHPSKRLRPIASGALSRRVPRSCCRGLPGGAVPGGSLWPGSALRPLRRWSTSS